VKKLSAALLTGTDQGKLLKGRIEFYTIFAQQILAGCYWPISEAASRRFEVSSGVVSGPELLSLSVSHFDP
jgi:hypothetical protein